MSSEQLCDRLFNDEPDFWRSSHHAPRDESGALDVALRNLDIRRESIGRTGSQPRPDRPTEEAQSYNMLAFERPALQRAKQRLKSTAAETAKPTTSWLRTLGLLVLLVTFLGTVFGLWKTHELDHNTIVPIQDRRVGQRVIVDAPQEALATDVARLNDREATWNATDGSLTIEGIDDPLRQLASEASSDDIKAADYRLIQLRAYDVWADGTLNQINVETLQPWQWIQQHEAHVGADAPLPLDAFEMGLPEGMTGTVIDILACPKIKPGRGRIILTTVNQLNNDIHELTLEGKLSNRETLRTTGNHLFYSVSSGQWESATELQAGETLDGVKGKVTLVASRPIPGTHRVYNFTVQGEHLYRVANSGVLVHNNYAQTNEAFYRAMSKGEYDSLVKNGGLSLKQGGANRELFVTQSLEYAQRMAAKHPSKYEVIVRFNAESGTLAKLRAHGASNNVNDFPALGVGNKNVVHVKLERGIENYGLREGTLPLFNNSRIIFGVVE